MSGSESFEAFFAAQHGAAVRLAASLGPATGADDVAAEAFERLYRRWDRVAEPLPYLRRTVRSLVVDDLRFRDVARRHAPVTVLHDEADVRRLDDDVAARAELMQALRQLAPRQREVVVLRYGLDMSEADVALSMGISVGTVKSSAARGLAALRALVLCQAEAAA